MAIFNSYVKLPEGIWKSTVLELNPIIIHTRSWDDIWPSLGVNVRFWGPVETFTNHHHSIIWWPFVWGMPSCSSPHPKFQISHWNHWVGSYPSVYIDICMCIYIYIAYILTIVGWDTVLLLLKPQFPSPKVVGYQSPHTKGILTHTISRRLSHLKSTYRYAGYGLSILYRVYIVCIV